MQTAAPIPFDNSYARLPERFHARLEPKSVAKPSLIALNEQLAESLRLNSQWLRSADGVAMLAGNHVPPGAEPLAMAYAGQQFGHWSPQLGDGRALLLGEVIGEDGRRHDIQLKGSGPTPFSRQGDGRSWLGPVLREYIVSEAMHALGVPTTRALAAVATGESVMREQVLPGAVFARVARAHLRVGTFQYFAIRSDVDALEKLADYAIQRLYPQAQSAADLLAAVIEAQAKLVARWMSLGFIHGVMNTDNVSIAGETIDYGPCAFMDAYHANRVFSSIDEGGRYAYSNQPKVAHWNLVQFAQALLPLLGETEEAQIAAAQKAVDRFPATYEAESARLMNAKLGLASSQEGDSQLVGDLLAIMQDEQADFTLTFRRLGSDRFRGEFLDLARIDSWLERWHERVQAEGVSEADLAERLRCANPAFIARNHRVEETIAAALKDDLEPFHRLNRALQNPFIDQPDDADLMLAPEPNQVVRYTFCGT
ncbi:MAG: YdiU family protein [Ahrensia sp.]|nr:YdiU family protein [Ahrensia sp.]